MSRTRVLLIVLGVLLTTGTVCYSWQIAKNKQRAARSVAVVAQGGETITYPTVTPSQPLRNSSSGEAAKQVAPPVPEFETPEFEPPEFQALDFETRRSPSQPDSTTPGGSDVAPRFKEPQYDAPSFEPTQPSSEFQDAYELNPIAPASLNALGGVQPVPVYSHPAEPFSPMLVQHPSLTKDKSFVVQLQKSRASGIIANYGEVPPMLGADASLFCNGINFEAAKEPSATEVPATEVPATREPVDAEEPGQQLQPPKVSDADTDTNADADADQIVESNPSVTKETDAHEHGDASESDPAQATPPRLRPLTTSNSVQSDASMAFTCDDDVTFVCQSVILVASKLSYKDGEFQFSDATLTTPLGKFQADELSLTYMLQGIKIDRLLPASEMNGYIQGGVIDGGVINGGNSVPSVPFGFVPKSN